MHGGRGPKRAGIDVVGSGRLAIVNLESLEEEARRGERVELQRVLQRQINILNLVEARGI